MSEDRSIQEEHAEVRSNDELIHIALTEPDEDIAWNAIAELQRRGGSDIYERAQRLCASKEARARSVGADILGQLGGHPLIFHEEVVTTLLAMLAQEQEPQVLHSIAVALGHRQDPRAIEPLVRYKNHPDALVRYSVVYGLLGHEDGQAIQALIELATDLDADVRDWATFGLGSLIETDTPAIRAALLARLTDEDANTRSEAIAGLARRHDVRMVEPLLQDLQEDRFGSLSLEAATESGDVRLYPALLRLRETWKGDKDSWLYQELEQALDRCRPAEK